MALADDVFERDALALHLEKFSDVLIDQPVDPFADAECLPAVLDHLVG
jgi:hypothetical protein